MGLYFSRNACADAESRGNLAKDLVKACPAAEHRCQDIREEHDYEYATMRSAQIMFNMDVSFRTVANIVRGKHSIRHRPQSSFSKHKPHPSMDTDLP